MAEQVNEQLSTGATASNSSANSSSLTESIILRSPIKYGFSTTAFKPPSLEWLERTWAVTASTLPMWRKAKNVRITYKLIPPSTPGGRALLDDTVESEPTERTWLPQPKTIKGVDTSVGKEGEEDQGWNWRGRGWLKIASSHWEVLGWGERGGEKWAVTWFAPSMFTPAGLDIYSDRKEGMSDELAKDIEEALAGLEAKDVVALCRDEMRTVVLD